MPQPRTILAIVFLFSLPALASADQLRGQQPAIPKAGIKIPGIQIPFSSLIPEAELPAPSKPAWLAFSGGLFLPAANALIKIDAKTNQPAAPAPQIGNPCGGVVSAFGSLWVAACRDGILVRLDPKDLKIIAKIALGASPSNAAIAGSADSVWMLSDGKTTLVRVDPDLNSAVAEIRLPAGCRSLVFGESALWVACPSENKVLRINPATNLIDQSIAVSAQPESLTLAEGSVWALCRKDGKIDRIDPKTNKVSKTIELRTPGSPGSITAGSGSLWVTMTGFPLTRIDPKTESVAQQFYGDAGGAITASPGAVWLSNLNRGTLWRIDPKRIQATLAE